MLSQIADKNIIREYITTIEWDRNKFIVAQEIINILQWNHYEDERMNKGKSSASTYDVTNYPGLGVYPELFTNDIIIHKLLYEEFGGDDKLMSYNEDTKTYTLKKAWITRINTVFNEMESHYLRYQPAVRRLMSQSFSQYQWSFDMNIDKEMKIKWEVVKSKWFKLSTENELIALQQLTKFIKVIGLLETSEWFGSRINWSKEDPSFDEAIYWSQTTRDLFGRYINFFRRRLHMDLSLVYQKRATLFSTLANDLLEDSCVTYNSDDVVSHRVPNATSYEDYSYKMNVPFVLNTHGKTIKCTLRWRTKSSKSINDKLETNPNYGYVEAMNDLFGFTVTTEYEENLPEVFDWLATRFEQQKINQREHNPQNMKFSQKWWLFTKIKEQLEGRWYETSSYKRHWSAMKLPKVVTDDKYQDCKRELDIINIDGHAAGVEIKCMTDEMFDYSENDPDAGSNAMKFKDKFSKEWRIPKLIGARYISKLINKIQKKGTYRWSHIDPQKIKDYLKQSLELIEFTHEWKNYLAYLSKNHKDHFRINKLLKEYRTMDRITPTFLDKIRSK